MTSRSHETDVRTVSVRITSDLAGVINGVRTAVGDVVKVAERFAALLENKGHAERVATPASKKTKRTVTADETR